MDKYLDWLKNHKIIGFLIVIGMIVIAAGDLVDAVDKLSNFFLHKKQEEPQYTSIPVLIHIKNKTRDDIRIESLVHYSLTEKKGSIVQAHDNGRVLINPIYSDNTPYSILANSSKKYTFTLPKAIIKSIFFLRGVGNLHVSIKVKNDERFYEETLPLVKSALEEYPFEYIITPRKVDIPNSLYNVFITYYPSRKKDADKLKEILLEKHFNIVHFHQIPEGKLNPRKSEIIFYSDTSKRKVESICSYLSKNNFQNISANRSKYFGDKKSKNKIYINLL